MITDTTVVHIQATPQQFAQLDANCTVSEELFAMTLLQHMSRKPPEEHKQAVMEWFRCVRQMAFANFIVSGIRVLDRTSQTGLATVESKERSVDEKLQALLKLLNQFYEATPTPMERAEIRKAIE